MQGALAGRSCRKKKTTKIKNKKEGIKSQRKTAKTSSRRGGKTEEGEGSSRRLRAVAGGKRKGQAKLGAVCKPTASPGIGGGGKRKLKGGRKARVPLFNKPDTSIGS